ncbi:MAG TPA: clostripain-related cysteine peptidase [Candidatus Xenobia bacterium]
MIQSLSAALPRPLTKKPQAPPAQADTVQLTPPGRNPHDPAKATWTVLIYSAGDNNLLPNLTQNLVDLQKAGSSKSLNVVSQFDQGGSVGCNRYYVTKSGGDTFNSPTVGQPLGTVDMADPKTLSDFIQWGVKTYPAEHYMVIISDHGDGWRGAVEDDSAGTFMSLPNIQKGLQTAQDATGVKPDILGFDACLMANAEVADQLKNNASYLVASEETEGLEGWPYTNLLGHESLRHLNQLLLTKDNLSAKDFAGAIVQDATAMQGVLPTLSAFDLGQVDTLTGAMKGLADAIKASGTPGATLRQVADGSQQFTDTTDLYDFADQLGKSADVKDDAVKHAADGVKTAVKGLIYAEQHDASKYPNAHGVTANLAQSTDDYRGLDLPKSTGWDTALDKMQA